MPTSPQKRRHLARWLMCVTIGMAATSALTEEPVLFWARVVPGAPRSVWLHGRHLWTGPEKVAEAATLDLEPTLERTGSENTAFRLTFDRLHGGNDQDQNRSLPFLQRFLVPADVPAGEHVGRWRRNDGRSLNISLTLPPAESPSPPAPITKVSYLDAPLVITEGQAVDLTGTMLVPSATFPEGKSLVVLGAGSTLQNGAIFCPEGSRPSRAIWIEPGRQARLASLTVMNLDNGEPTLFLRSQEDAFFADLRIVGSRCVDANPGDAHRRNTWLRCTFTAPRRSADGQVGRGIGGAENLIAWCHWHDIDRGPTLSPQGSPLDRIAWFECSQLRTGLSDGASEGLLVECKKVARAEIELREQRVVLRFPKTGMGYLVRPGYCIMREDATAEWARITEPIAPRDADGRSFSCSLDRNLGTGAGPISVLVGNAQVECSYLRCRFVDGKSGIWFWGASLGNVVVGCEFRDLDFGVGLLDRLNPPSDSGFSRDLVQRFNQFRRVGQEVRILK